jgi:hypothetical protein
MHAGTMYPIQEIKKTVIHCTPGLNTVRRQKLMISCVRGACMDRRRAKD